MASVRRFLSGTNSSSSVNVAIISAYADSNSESKLDDEVGIAEELDEAVVGGRCEVTDEEDTAAADVTDFDWDIKELSLSFANSHMN